MGVENGVKILWTRIYSKTKKMKMKFINTRDYSLTYTSGEKRKFKKEVDSLLGRASTKAYNDTLFNGQN